MNYNRTRNFLCPFKNTHHGINVMAVQRACVFKAEINKKIVCQENTLYSPLESENQFSNMPVEIWDSVNKMVNLMPESLVGIGKCKP